MSFPKDDAATFRPASAVPPLRIRTTGVRFVAPGAATQGRFGLFEWMMAPDSGGADPHYHRTISESFFIVSGAVRLYTGGQWITATAGDFLHVAEGGAHGFKNESGAAAQMLILFAPGIPREAYFEALAEISASGRKLTPDEWTDLYNQHDQYEC